MRATRRQGIKTQEEKKEGGRGLRSHRCRKPSAFESSISVSVRREPLLGVSSEEQSGGVAQLHSLIDFQGKVIEPSSTSLIGAVRKLGHAWYNASKTEKQSRNVVEFNANYLDVALPFPSEKKKKRQKKGLI